MRLLVQPGIGVRSKNKTVVNLLTNRSPPSSIGGRFTRDGFTNNLSRRAVTRCSKTRCIQHKKSSHIYEITNQYNILCYIKV